MAKFFGIVGYGQSVEEPADSGNWKDVITEFPYYGDILRNSRRHDRGENLVGDISVSNRISIVADEYANQHFFAIRFVEWSGTFWTVTDVEVQSPRLLLTLGEVYNGPRA